MNSRILVIDDDATILKMMELVLKSAGFSVSTSTSGRHGLDTFGKGSEFDLVITDYRMPELSGLEVLEEILERRSDAKVIVVSGFGGIDTALEAINRGAIDFLRKPYAPTDLREAVESAIKGGERLSPVATVCKEFSQQDINGFNFELSEELVDEHTGNLTYIFEIQRGQDSPRYVKVILPAYAQELIKAFIDADEVPFGARFYQALCEQKMAQYLRENGSIPSSASILIDDLEKFEQDWINSMMTVSLAPLSADSA